jgi:hypothetical protein
MFLLQDHIFLSHLPLALLLRYLVVFVQEEFFILRTAYTDSPLLGPSSMSASIDHARLLFLRY